MAKESTLAVHQIGGVSGMETRFVQSVTQFLKECCYPPPQDHNFAYFLLGGACTTLHIGSQFAACWIGKLFFRSETLPIYLSISPPSLSGSGGAMLFMILVGTVWLLISGFARRGAMLYERDARIAQLDASIKQLQERELRESNVDI